MRKTLTTMAFLASAMLQGCATSNALYSWGPYENQVYEHFKGESPEKQIQILEQHAQAARAKGQKLPPGFSAHLGLLYGKVGRDDAFIAALEEEKANFPESAPYINNLLKKSRQGDANAKK